MRPLLLIFYSERLQRRDTTSVKPRSSLDSQKWYSYLSNLKWCIQCRINGNFITKKNCQICASNWAFTCKKHYTIKVKVWIAPLVSTTTRALGAIHHWHVWGRQIYQFYRRSHSISAKTCQYMSFDGCQYYRRILMSDS